MRVLLISTYELGHQPLHVASPAAALRQAGLEVRTLDTSVESLGGELLDWADRVAISVPMHTAMRLGVQTAKRIRSYDPTLPIAFYGLYAAMSADRTVGALVDAALVGEYEPALSAWCRGEQSSGVCTDLSTGTFLPPDRSGLPALDRYAHLAIGDTHRLVGYVEASHGCRHRCRHCPIPAVYDGLYRIVGSDPLMADIEQLVAMGAGHITFGDPDFFNGPVHSLRVIERAHTAFPDLTFDVTIKVEHLLDHRDLLPRLAAANTLFVVSAFETTHEASLRLLDKGHTPEDMVAALAAARNAGLEVHPSWMPFMPWTTPQHVADIFSFLDRFDLLEVTDPVQLSIRLLIPEGSLMLDVVPLDEYDADALTYRWVAEDEGARALQAELARLAADGADTDRVPLDVLTDMWRASLDAAGHDLDRAQIPAGATAGRPRMSEPWFC